MRLILPRLPLVSVTCLICLIAIWSFSQEEVAAQSDCPTIPELQIVTWEPNKEVTVVFDESAQWSENAIRAIRRAFENWNASRGLIANNSGIPGNNSRVTFVGFQLGPHPDRHTVTHMYVITRLPGSTYNVSFDNPNSRPYVGLSRMNFPPDLDLEPPLMGS